MKHALSTLIFALTMLVACGTDDGAPPLDAPAARVASVFVDECGNTLYSDEFGARRLYVSVAPHIYVPPIPSWEELSLDEQKPWLAAVEEYLSFATCQQQKQ